MKVHTIRFATYAALVAIGLIAWRSKTPTPPVNLIGADFPQIIATDMRNPKIPRLDQTKLFPALYRDASVAVAAAISKEGLRAADYYVELRVQDAGRILNFSLWHESVVGVNYDVHVRGDPSGKCRTVLFDSVDGVVTTISGWR
jgi:hypothetical protein